MSGMTGRLLVFSSGLHDREHHTSGGGYIYRSSKAAPSSVVKSLSNDLTDDAASGYRPKWVGQVLESTQTLRHLALSKSSTLSNIEVSGHFFNFDGTEINW